MKEDQISELFKDLEGTFNVHNISEGHQKRFLEKLNAKDQTTKSVIKWRKALSIAALIAVVFVASSLFLNEDVTAAELASVSPEMEQTQSFFTSTINNELQTLKSFESPETEILVQDALEQLENLENKYEILKLDLVESGNNKRVIYAMIKNFQNRIDLLEQVISTIEEVKKLKNLKNENKI